LPSRNLHFTREKTRQRAHLILKPWKRSGLENFSRTKEDEMTAATFDHQVGISLEFFEQQRNEETACARFIGALYFEARAESRMRLEADTVSAQTESRPEPARLPAAVLLGLQPTRLPLQGEADLMISDESTL